jgi:hypothetical protein
MGSLLTEGLRFSAMNGTQVIFVYEAKDICVDRGVDADLEGAKQSHPV